MTRNLYCIVGPSGSGKSTLAAGLAKQGYKETISHTTRPCRGGSDVNSYVFVTDKQLRAMVCDGVMLEYVEYAGHYYGTAMSALLTTDFILVDLPGVKNLRKKYNVRPIKVIGLTAGTAELQQRLSDRTDDSASRVEDDRQRFWHLREQADIVIEGKSIEETLQAALEFIKECEEGVS